MRGKLFAIAIAATLMAMPAAAEGLADDLVKQLHDQGYPNVDVSRTLLGRIRLVAENDTEWREIIVNPRTGEILRDYTELTVSDDIVSPTLLSSGSGVKGSNSGSGSSGSNSSGSNSGSGSSGGSGSGSSGGSGSGSSGGSGSGSSGGSGGGSSGGSGGGSDDSDDD